MKISLSLTSFDGSIDKQLEAACKSPHDLIHLDYMDNFDLIYVIKKLKERNIQADLHIVSSSPEDCLNKLKDNNCLEYLNHVFVQIENLQNLSLYKTYKVNPAIVVSTNWNLYKEQIIDAESLLIMTTVPGISGGKFDESTYEKIKLANEFNSNLRLYVDGGVSSENFSKLNELSIHTVVIGSFLAKATDINLRYAKLRHDQNLSVPLVSLSEPIKNLPVTEDVSLDSVLRIMNKYSSNFTLVKDQKIIGIITDGDLKRNLVSNHLISNSPLPVNKDFFVMDETNTLEDLFTDPRFRFEMGCIPLKNSNQEILNAIDLRSLIRK
jgi:pentose-5-phosphate-3-epimerase